MITREMLLEWRDRLALELERLRAQAYAYEGAIQDCDHWLGVLEGEQEKRDADG